MRLGFFGAGVGSMAAPGAGDVARLAEDLGYASLWAPDHMLFPVPTPAAIPRDATYPMADPLVMLSFLAACTTTIKLCTGVLLVPQRHPVQLAKELATLDVLSGGRLVVGMGLGYIEAELRAMGVDPQRRADLALEHLAAMRALWSMSQPRFDGPTVSFADVDAYPRPVRANGPPIVMGGWTPAACRRAAAHADGWYGWGLSLEEVRRVITSIRVEGERIERDLSGFTVAHTPTQRLSTSLIEDYADAGVDELVVSIEAPDIAGIERRLELNAPSNYGIAK
jgi:probable F420-dependent oxidoreductase